MELSGFIVLTENFICRTAVRILVIILLRNSYFQSFIEQQQPYFTKKPNVSIEKYEIFSEHTIALIFSTLIYFCKRNSNMVTCFHNEDLIFGLRSILVNMTLLSLCHVYLRFTWLIAAEMLYGWPIIIRFLLFI